MGKDAVFSSENQVVYIGIDVHKQSWNVHLRFPNLTLKRSNMEPSASGLRTLIDREYPGLEYRCVYEAGFTGFSTYRSLMAVGLETIVVNAADVPTSDKEHRMKSDPVDSEKLACSLSAGLLRGIAIPSVEQEGLRQLDRVYDQLVRQRTETKNHIRSFLDVNGIAVPRRKDPDDPRKGRMGAWGKEFIDWLSEVAVPSAAGRATLDLYVFQLSQHETALKRHRKVYDAALKEDAAAQTTMKHLKSIIGIGPITAATLYTELYDITRFDSFDQLCSYAGLIPTSRSSGQQSGHAQLTRRCNHRVRTRLIESAWVAITRDPSLLRLFPKESAGKKIPGQRQKAAIKVARKLLERVWIVWRRNAPWKQRAPEAAASAGPRSLRLRKVDKGQ